MSKIGFIGLGHMGLPMAMNLVKAGHEVKAFDLVSTQKETFRLAGGHFEEKLKPLKNQDIIITMLQTGSQVLEVCLSLSKEVKPQTLFIDCSTIDVASSRQFHTAITQAQCLSLDAPVSGGVAGAEAGTLTFMVGGEDLAFQKAEPLFSILGKKIIRAGGATSGQAAKICNNMILGISMAAISEGFALAKTLGLSPQKLHEVVSHASGQCWAMDHYVPVAHVLENVPANHHFQPGFSAKMMLKDLLLSQESAHKNHLSTPIASQATALYQHFIDQGLGDLDFSAIIKLIDPSGEMP